MSVYVPNCIYFLLQRLKESMSGDGRDFNNIETLAVIKFFLLQSKTQKEIHTILKEKNKGNMHHRMPLSKIVWST